MRWPPFCPQLVPRFQCTRIIPRILRFPTLTWWWLVHRFFGLYLLHHLGKCFKSWGWYEWYVSHGLEQKNHPTLVDGTHWKAPKIKSETKITFESQVLAGFNDKLDVLLEAWRWGMEMSRMDGSQKVWHVENMVAVGQSASDSEWPL